METKMTVKKLLEKKYSELLLEVKQILKKDLFPVLDDEFNWKDFLIYIDFIFPDDDLEFHINQICFMKAIDITDQQKLYLIPIVKEYLNWLKKFKIRYPNF